MSGSLLKSFEEDISQIPPVERKPGAPKEMVMRTLAHAYLPSSRAND